jgi:hypothetical protein
MYRLKISLFLFFSLTLTSCCPLTSLNHLSDPDKAEYDQRIEGSWKLQDDKQGFLHIGKGPDNKTLMVLVGYKSGGEVEFNTYNVFPTIVGDQNYLNFNNEELFDKSIKEGIRGYTFIKYELLNPKTLVFSIINNEPVIEAIKTGKLKGEITYKKAVVEKENRKDAPQQNKAKTPYCVKITDSSDNIINFFQSVDSKELFEDFYKFTRIE